MRARADGRAPGWAGDGRGGKVSVEHRGDGAEGACGAAHVGLEGLDVADELLLVEVAVEQLAVALAELPPAGGDEELGAKALPLLLFVQVLWHAVPELKLLQRRHRQRGLRLGEHLGGASGACL